MWVGFPNRDSSQMRRRRPNATRQSYCNANRQACKENLYFIMAMRPRRRVRLAT